MREADYKTNLEVAGKSPSRKSCIPTMRAALRQNYAKKKPSLK